MGWPLIVVVWSAWLIGNTNLQSLWARLKAFWGCVNLPPAKLWS
ncbi:hypothetical protein PFWH6_5029 [Pseudomonas fluorescens WH6]|nr:hypothetical protein PFWH6_5029 [Pseudomonas fluorescens WH6]